jgi:predicted transcriptional regulator
MTASTTLKLPEKLKARVARIAKESGRSPHGVMVEAIEREVDRTERYRQFVKDAQAADKAIDAGAEVYSAGDVHTWMERLARDGKAERPKALRK